MGFFIDIKQLDVSRIQALLARAQNWLHPEKQVALSPKYKLQHTVAHLFFEPSTRTSLSFELAAKRLRFHVLTPNLSFSSLSKGETILDTVYTLGAMGVDTCIIRHGENGILRQLADRIPGHCPRPINLISGGEGSLQHPTQALSDLLTIQQHYHHHSWDTLRVAILGDIQYSRVARSLIDGLLIMGVSDIRLIAPPALQLRDTDYGNDETNTKKVTRFTNSDQGVEGADVVVCLRVQKERFTPTLNSNTHAAALLDADFHTTYGLTEERLKKAKKSAIVLHPGPINRDIEIASAVADGPQSVILRQVANGVAVRMAVLEGMLPHVKNHMHYGSLL